MRKKNTGESLNMNSKLKKLIIGFSSKKEELLADKLLKDFSIPPSYIEKSNTSYIISHFDAYTLLDIRNECAYQKLNYDDSYELTI